MTGVADTAVIMCIRYCPSILSKLRRFSGQESHHVWLEPEGLNTSVVYPNGISNALPEDVQLQMLHSIPGLEHVAMLKPGI